MLRGTSAFLLALSATSLVSGLTLNKLGTQASLAADADTTAILKQVEAYTFSDFVRDHRRSYVPGSKEWEMREGMFEQNKKAIIEHHKGLEQLWTPGFNKFADWTEVEFKKLMGYKPNRDAHTMLNFRERAPEATTDGSQPIEHGLDLHMELPEGHDNREHLPLTGSYIRDQGGCGSCWAVSSATVLEAHLEKTGTVLAQLPSKDSFEDVALSAQALTSCTENPNKCGGSGGCEGATAELAFQLVKDKGIPMAKNYLYTSSSGESGQCNQEKLAASTISIENFVKLPQNKYQHLLHALYQSGPAVVSVAAGSWMFYAKGIFHDQNSDFVIDHAVAAMGFGVDSGNKYWLIKNSWGKEWGEEGHIRLLRTDDEEEHCGWDMKPEEGTGCAGGPEKVWVCGHSGILYDSSYPVGVHMK